MAMTFKPDEGRAWFVLVAAFLGVGIITDGIGYAFGLIYIELLRVYEQSYQTTSWIGSLQATCGSLFSIPMAYLIEKQGCRRATIIFSVIAAVSFLIDVFVNNVYVFYLTLGALAGIGILGVELTSQVVVQRCFNRKRLLANGIATSGTGFGILCMGPTIHWLISFYGLHGTFLILCGICLNGVAFGLIIPPNEEFRNLQQNEEKYEVGNKGDIEDYKELSDMAKNEKQPLLNGKSETIIDQMESTHLDQDKNASTRGNGYMRIMTNVYFILFCVGATLFHVTLKAVIIFFPHRAHEDFGLTTQQTSLLLTVLGGTHIIVRPLLGLLGTNQTSKQRKQIVLAMAALVNGLINLISISFDSMVTQTIFIIIYGISGALVVTYQYPVLCEIIDMSDLEKASGFYHMAIGPLFVPFVPLCGWFVDITGNYVITFIVFGCLQLVATISLCLLPIVMKLKGDT